MTPLPTAIKLLMLSVSQHFEAYRTHEAPVHTFGPLAVLADKLVEMGLISAKIKNRRQGARGRRSARNYLLRQALWLAHQHTGRPYPQPKPVVFSQ